MADMLTARDLSDRYGGWVSIKTLANWRSKGSGPDYVRIGGKVFYPLDAIEEWELKNRSYQPQDRELDLECPYYDECPRVRDTGKCSCGHGAAA